MKKTLLSIKNKAFLGCSQPQAKPKRVLGPEISGRGGVCAKSWDEAGTTLVMPATWLSLVD